MRAVILSLLLALSAIVVAPVDAQSSLKEEQKAVLVFDLRMEMLSSSPLGKQIKLAEMVTEAQKQSGQGGADPSKVVRMFGAVSAPKSLAEVENLQPNDEAPFEFFMRSKFQDSESATEAFNDAVEKGGDRLEQIEKDGHTFYKSLEDGEMPPGFMLHQVDETTIEIGTEAYVFHPDRKVFTDNLKAAWGKAPNEAIRLAVDLKGAEGLVADLVEQGKNNAPMPGAEAYLELINNISNMGVSLDLSGKNLLSLRATANDSEQVEDLKGGLDSMLFLAQGAGKQAVQQFPLPPDVKQVAESILNSLAARQDGNDVIVEIPRPDGFEKAVAALVSSGIPLPGAGGPPPGGPGQLEDFTPPSRRGLEDSFTPPSRNGAASGGSSSKGVSDSPGASTSKSFGSDSKP